MRGEFDVLYTPFLKDVNVYLKVEEANAFSTRVPLCYMLMRCVVHSLHDHNMQFDFECTCTCTCARTHTHTHTHIHIHTHTHTRTRTHTLVFSICHSQMSLLCLYHFTIGCGERISSHLQTMYVCN